MSIIIPAYNTEKYIHRAIESSLRQTHKNVEVLIIDDGSADDTLKTAEGYAVDGRVRVFTQENAGVSVARNRGIREARGEYMMFLDSDDWLEDDAVEVLLDAQAKYPDRLIAGMFYSVAEDGRKEASNRGLLQPVLLNVQDIAESYCGINPANTGFHSAWAKIFSSEIIKQYRITFPEGIAFSEDAVFVMRYLYQVNGAFLLDKPIYSMYLLSTSATRHSYSPKNLQSQIDAYEILINLPENTPEVKKLMRISRTHYIMMYVQAGLQNKLNGVGRAEIMQIRNYLRPYAGEFLSCNKISVKRRIRFLIEMYFPIWLGKAIMTFKNAVKRLPS